MCKVRILFSSLLDMMCGSLKEKNLNIWRNISILKEAQVCGLMDFKQLRVGMFHSDWYDCIAYLLHKKCWIVRVGVDLGSNGGKLLDKQKL